LPRILLDGRCLLRPCKEIRSQSVFIPKNGCAGAIRLQDAATPPVRITEKASAPFLPTYRPKKPAWQGIRNPADGWFSASHHGVVWARTPGAPKPLSGRF